MHLKVDRKRFSAAVHGFTFTAGDLERFLTLWTVYTIHHVLVLPVIFLCLANREARAYVKRILCLKAHLNAPIGPTDCAVEPRKEAGNQLTVQQFELRDIVSSRETEVDKDFSTVSTITQVC